MPDSPVTAKMLTDHEKRITVIRLKDNQTGVENKHLKPYQVWEAFKDPKLYLFYVLGTVCNLPNGGISNFGTLIVKGIFDDKLLAAAMQAPYGAFIAFSIGLCVYLNDRFPNNNRCKFVLLFLCPNIAGAFGLRFVPQSSHAGRYICYLLTGPYNAAFVLILSLQIANTAGHTKKVVTNAVVSLLDLVHVQLADFFPVIPGLLYRQHSRTILLPVRPGAVLRTRYLEHDRESFDRSLCGLSFLVPAGEGEQEKG